MALTIYTNSSPQKSLLELNIFVSLRFELKSHFKIEKTPLCSCIKNPQHPPPWSVVSACSGIPLPLHRTFISLVNAYCLPSKDPLGKSGSAYKARGVIIIRFTFK